MAKHRTHTIHECNCRNQVRATVYVGGTTITLMGKYGFGWKIVRETNGRIIIEEYENRKQARKEFQRYEKCKK